MPTADLLLNWGLAFARPRPDIPIPGSPERCVARRVVEDRDGRLWLLEQLGPGQRPRREALGVLLAGLGAQGLERLAPYRRAASGGFTATGWGRAWQLSPFVQGVPLHQPGYLADAAKGRALGTWLCDLRRASAGLELPDGLFALDLPPYVHGLLRSIERQGRRGPETAPSGSGGWPGATGLARVHARASALLPALGALLEAWDSLPAALCHGDIHPLNAVWGVDGLLAVIDWEFAGIRPALYDLANCLGCLAMEGGSLGTPFAAALLRSVREGGLLPGGMEGLLGQAMLATRFGWLSEWLRRRDWEMAASELAFMEFLAENPVL